MGIANKPTNKMLASQRGGSKKIWIQRCRKWLGPSSTQIRSNFSMEIIRSHKGIFGLSQLPWNQSELENQE